MWFWFRWPCRLSSSLNDEPVAWQYPSSQPLGSESPNALPARMTTILAMQNLDSTLHPEVVRRGFILDFVQNSSCVRAMLFRNTISVGWKLIPRLTAASLAQLGERRSAGGGGGRVMSTARKVGDKGRQAAVCRILALSYFSQVLAARRRIQTEYWVRQKSTEHCQV